MSAETEARTLLGYMPKVDAAERRKGVDVPGKWRLDVAEEASVHAS